MTAIGCRQSFCVFNECDIQEKNPMVYYVSNVKFRSDTNERQLNKGNGL